MTEWTTAPPSEAGWYWMKMDGGTPEVVHASIYHDDPGREILRLCRCEPDEDWGYFVFRDGVVRDYEMGRADHEDRLLWGPRIEPPEE